MANNNEPKGSKWNPYSYDEYSDIYTSTNQTWYGGWVKSSSNDHVAYFNMLGDPIPDPYVRDYGSLEHPFTLFQRQTIMNENPGFWPGGWSESNDGVKYYLTGAIFYDATNNIDEPLGSASYPCPIEVYSNMCKNGIWNGGYVTYGGPDDIYFVDRGEIVNGNGAGCGCSSGNGTGSGSGSGSGCGSDDGEITIIPGEQTIAANEDMEMKISWDATPRFSLSAIMHQTSSIKFILETTTISTIWNGHSTATVTGSYSYAKLHVAAASVQGETFEYEGYVVTNVEHKTLLVSNVQVNLT